MATNLVSGPILAHLTQIRPAIFFFFFFFFFFSKIWFRQSLDIMTAISCTISDKNNDPILRKLSDGWTDESDEAAVRVTLSVQI